jgi:transposase-like protein
MWCKGCNHTFTLESEAGFEKMQVTSKMVTVALDLYFKGTSLRKITDHLEQFYERKLDHTTVLYWVKKYTAIISEYAETLNPKLGGIWHADEMKVKTKRDEWSWLWHVMDSETRFMVANLVTKKREVEDAQELFREAREAGKPELLITDGLQSYHKAFNKEFYDHYQESEHVVAAGLTARSNNNKVERLHNTVRERVKVMRGLHSDKSAAVFNAGFKTYYNYIRPNQALKGKTPVEVAGVDLELGENKWLGLLKKAMENTKG